MRKVLVIFFFTLAFYGRIVQAQVPTPAPVPRPLSLGERYALCIGSALCPLQVRLQIVQEEMNEMNARFQRVVANCAARNFQDCTDSQKADMDQWHSADYRAGQMMLSIHAQSLALKESAAGDASQQAAEQKKTFWERLWGK